MTRVLKNVLIIFILFFTINFSFAEILYDSNYNYSVDIPEGFQISDMSDDSTSILFTHPNIAVTLAIKVYNDKSFSSSEEALLYSLRNLSSNPAIDTATWNGKKCSLSEIDFTLDKNYSGWAVSAELINKTYITLLCYASKDISKGAQQFIISTLNSLCVDFDYYNAPGIFVNYAFPKKGDKKVELIIDGTKISSKVDKTDEEAAQFIVDLEYSVLTLYQNHKSWKEAWQRYYRQIYKDNYYRLNSIFSDIQKGMKVDFSDDKSKLNYLQKILFWVQDFSYERNNSSKKEADFTNLVSSVLGKGNDCDSRSMLICAFAKNVGIDGIMVVSNKYSHAVSAINIDAPGQKYKLGDKYYLYGETTAKLTFGIIEETLNDKDNWLPVIFQ
ncbi:MAG: hypothetical protein GX677_09405 [Treponema sp.]|jgi:hypothetical protein|nr:hypothetical protein [Treponema sp.]